MTRITIGSVTLIPLVDSIINIPVEMFFSKQTEEIFIQAGVWNATPAKEKRIITLPVRGWLIRTPTLNILVDTCWGADRSSERINNANGNNLLTELKKVGVGRHEINFVVITHSHHDHSGWNTKINSAGKFVPTFPKAKYFLQKQDLQFAKHKYSNNLFSKRWKPLQNAAVLELLEGRKDIDMYVSIEPNSGHTPGHQYVHVHSDGQNAIIIGDSFHVPAQVSCPNCCPLFDENKSAAINSRMLLLERAVKENAVFCPSHFPHPGYGHITRPETGKFEYHPAHPSKI